MATCNDCVYYPVCNYKMRCDSFKDKTNFVEVVRCKDCKWYQNLGIVGKAQRKVVGNICDSPELLEGVTI